MCELNVFLLKGEEREKVMEGVVRITVQEGGVLLEGIFGETMMVEGRLVRVDIMAQKADLVAG
ncbi:MAG: CooT family nickel-binding protein [Methanothrix sp.]|nr:CooT family nickel-binding protein [Methanothrix sp.]